MKICILCNEYPPNNGGIGTFTKEIAEALSLNHTVIVVGYYKNIEFSTDEIINGVRVVRLKMILNSDILSRISLYSFIKESVRKKEIDIIESPDHIGLTAFWPEIYIPIVSRLHGTVTYFKNELALKSTVKTFFWKIIESSSLKKATSIVSVSNYTARKTKEYFGLNQNIETIYNGVVPSSRQKSCFNNTDGNYEIIYAGTISERKGALTLARAWRDVIKVYPNAKLNIAGRDDGTLDKIYSIVGQKKNIFYHGMLQKSQLNDLYTQMDLAVFPSFSECFSLAPMEAMNIGVPVIYTTLCSGKELITEGIDGWLIDPSEPALLTSAIIKYFDLSADVKLDYSRKSKLTIENKFNFDELLNQNVSFYERVINDF
ncbi:glycosyltransferase family 4 protein [Vibrio breoganii]